MWEHLILTTMLENITIPAGFNKVEDLSKVAESGNRTFSPFFKGDTVEFSDTIVSKNTLITRQGVKQETPIYYIIASVNGGEPRPIPFGAFRRFPKDYDTFLEKSPLARLLFSGSDRDRFDLLKGRKIKVVDIVEGETVDFEKSDFSTHTLVYKKSKFPLFDYA